METGTGKTYVYTKAMFELHKQYGLNKFVIVVPSLAIKAGTAQFLLDDYTRHHFRDSCGYDCTMEVNVLEAPKGQKKGRSYFPSAVEEFVKGSFQNNKKIYVLLVNMQLLTNAKLLSRDDYDYGVEGFYKPLDAIKATKPVVIIDEPHRFAKGNAAFKSIIENMAPQCIIRFGATFPETSSGKGKNKLVSKDYQNLLYNLDACESFNQGLIKGVAKEHFESISNKEEKVKITAIDGKESIHLSYRRKGESTKSFVLKKGDSLAIVNEAFTGITIEAIGKSSVEFSNGIIKNTGEELDVDIYMTSYQEQMLRLALKRHFETERENFNRPFKIKTLALFFIDDITSYRKDSNGKNPYLLESFENLLEEAIKQTLESLTPQESEYKSYLEASLANIPSCHAGYFAQDNSSSDEDIAKEIDTILHKKKELLTIRKTDGTFNTLRFLFSKWTLKEGWDNPNVFTIAKLRSSGSENSKLQEVGRGLRLPVDENGNRISNEEFTLNYIVDFTEADFADKLVQQINGEMPQTMTISEDKLLSVAKKLNTSADDLFDELYCIKKYIDRNKNIRPESRGAFFEEYPDFATGLKTGIIKDRNKEKHTTIKVRPKVFDKLRELWETINQRYLLFHDCDLNDNLEQVVLSLFEKKGVFSDSVMRSERSTIRSTGSEMEVVRETGVSYLVKRTIPYNQFLKRVSKATNIPIKTIHSALCSYSEKHNCGFSEHLNDNTIGAFIKEFNEWKSQNLQTRFKYVKGDSKHRATALTYSDGSIRQEIAQGRIGTKIAPGVPSGKYLYDVMAYDSPLEKANILTDDDRIIVYGKIPRSSIAIPTITGETYSPDFMYIIKKADGTKELNIVIETKDVENKDSLRGLESIKINCAEIFFDMLRKDGYNVQFRTQLNNKQISQIIEELLINKEPGLTN